MGMTVGAELDRETGCLRLEANKPVTVAFRLTEERSEQVRVVIQDPATDAELGKSGKDIPVQLGL